jgi:histidinol-phosphate/aromatic aminotransferase/cobyric acid decarboxylase-like protein
MKKSSFDEKLLIEKEKLKRLADEALKKGIPLIQDEAFMEQNRKVDELIVKVQRYQEQQRKNQQER